VAKTVGLGEGLLHREVMAKVKINWIAVVVYSCACGGRRLEQEVAVSTPEGADLRRLGFLCEEEGGVQA
jgi:hypothetical protein